MITVDCSYALAIKDKLLVHVADSLKALPILNHDKFLLDSLDDAKIDKLDVIKAIEGFLESANLRKNFQIIPKGNTIRVELLDGADMKENLDKISDVNRNPFFECTHCGFMTQYEEELRTHRLIHYI